MSVKRILVVANRTAATHRLLAEVNRRAHEEECDFVLLIPDVTDRRRADWTLDRAVELMKREARGRVEGIVGGPHAFGSVRDAVSEGGYDEIIVSTHPTKLSRWLRRDLARRVEGLGLPVTVVAPQGGSISSKEAIEELVEPSAQKIM